VAGIEDVAARGFTKGSDAYERGRPSYPEDAVAFVVDRLGIGPATTVVDVGAGTGKFTRLLPREARVIAVEPVAAMRDKLAGTSPGVEALDGTAEAIPMDDGSADAVVVAQAFHWFRHQEALAEIARVLRSGGGFALVWNSRDTAEPWVARLSEVIRWNKGQIPTYDAGDERWIDVVAESGAFTPVELQSFRYRQEMDRAGLLDRVASTSYIADMADADRAAVLDRVRSLVADFPERFVLPYKTFVYWCHRR
jgi:SAM-dependent methyltransferase